MNNIICGDALEKLKEIPNESVDCCITSPPYWGLRDYGVESQLGLEKTPEEYVAKMVVVFREVKRILKKEGNCWLNLGDSYASSGRGGGDIDLDTGMDIQGGRGRLNKHKIIKPKDLVGIPWRVAFALQADGWYLRQDIIWHKPNPMPESVTDRCTKSHEYIFLLTKSPKYYFDYLEIQEKAVTESNEERPRMGQGINTIYNQKCGHKNLLEKGQSPHTMHLKRARQFGAKKQEGTMRKDVGNMFIDYGKRNKRSVWTVTTKPFSGAHFATFPEDLIAPMVLAGCPKKGIVMDIFMGAGTTAKVAQDLGRNFIGIELNPEYIKIAEKRLAQKTLF